MDAAGGGGSGGILHSITKGVQDARSSLTSRLGQTSSVSASLRAGVRQVTAPCKLMRDHEPVPGTQELRAGLAQAWTVRAATSRRGGSCSVWTYDKTNVDPQIVAMHRDSVARMSRLRHPAVLRILEPLEETRSLLCFVAEPVCGVLSRGRNHYDELDVKHGATQLADGLDFLASHGLVLRDLAPETVCVAASDGRWVIASFCFVHNIAPAAATSETSVSPQPSASLGLNLSYAAPEVVEGSTEIGPLADVFSLGLLIFTTLTGRQESPLGAPSNKEEYRAALSRLPVALNSASPGSANATSNGNGMHAVAVECLGACTAAWTTMRASAVSLRTSAWLTSDRRLAALLFLERLVEKPPHQVGAVLRELPTLLDNVTDTRVLGLRVLSPLLAELERGSTPGVTTASGTPSSASSSFLSSSTNSISGGGGGTKTSTTSNGSSGSTGLILTAVLDVASRLPRGGTGDNDDAGALNAVCTSLLPRMQSASGADLEVLLRRSPLLASALGAKHGPALLQMLLRGLESGDPRLQAAALSGAPAAAEAFNPDEVRACVLPAAERVMLSTSSSGTRVAAMASIASLLPIAGAQEDCVRTMQAVARVTAVDKTAETLLAAAELFVAVADCGGADVAARAVLPVACPILACRESLDAAQYETFIARVQSVMDSIVESGRTRRKAAGGLGTKRVGKQVGVEDHLDFASSDPLGGALQQMQNGATNGILRAPQHHLTATPMTTSTSGGAQTRLGSSSSLIRPQGAATSDPFAASFGAPPPPQQATSSSVCASPAADPFFLATTTTSATLATTNSSTRNIQGPTPGALSATPSTRTAADQLADLLAGPEPGLFAGMASSSSLDLGACANGGGAGARERSDSLI